VDHDGVTTWVAAYERTWRANDVDAVGEVFTVRAEPVAVEDGSAVARLLVR